MKKIYSTLFLLLLSNTIFSVPNLFLTKSECRLVEKIQEYSSEKFKIELEPLKESKNEIAAIIKNHDINNTYLASKIEALTISKDATTLELEKVLATFMYMKKLMSEHPDKIANYRKYSLSNVLGKITNWGLFAILMSTYFRKEVQARTSCTNLLTCKKFYVVRTSANPNYIWNFNSTCEVIEFAFFTSFYKWLTSTTSNCIFGNTKQKNMNFDLFVDRSISALNEIISLIKKQNSK